MVLRRQQSGSAVVLRQSYRLAGSLLLSVVLVASVPPAMAQTGFNPGGSSPTTTGATGGGIQGQVQEIQSFVQSYLKQFDQLKTQISGVIDQYTGQIGGEVSGAIKNALGELNLPDPSKLLDGILHPNKNGQNGQNGQQQDAALNNISGVLPSVLKNHAVAPILSQLWGQSNFSSDAQSAVKKDLQGIGQKVQAASQFVPASATLSNQSTQAASQSSQFASTAQTQSQQAQKRVSTQDAIKDLNLTAGTLSQQLAAQSNQLASESGQLSNLVNLSATQVEFQGDASAKLSQLNLGVAASVTQLSDMNAQMHGAEQLRAIQETALVNKVGDATGNAFHLLR